MNVSGLKAKILASLGDLSGLKVGYADFSQGVKLQEIILGSSSQGYTNERLYTLYTGNNPLLEKVDCTNCVNLGKGEQNSIDLGYDATTGGSGCTGLKYAYFKGTAITGIRFADTDTLLEVTLPADTLKSLRLVNQTHLTTFSLWHSVYYREYYNNITSLFIDKVSSIVPVLDILKVMETGSRVRWYNFNISMNSINDVYDFFVLLDKFRGMDQNGNNTEKAQVYGTITVPAASNRIIAVFKQWYSGITINYSSISPAVLYYNYDNTLGGVELVASGGTATNPPSLEKEPTNYYVYNFVGWALILGGEVDANALVNVTSGRNVYACYEQATRYYTVRLYSNITLLDTQYITYGNDAVYYDSESGTNIPPYYGSGDANDYMFDHWDPSLTNVTENRDCYAIFVLDTRSTRKYIAGTLISYTDQNALTDIGPYTFAYCLDLTTLLMPLLTFENSQKVPDYCFYECRKLQRFYLGSLNLYTINFSPVTEIGKAAFYNFSSYQTIINDSGNPVVVDLNFPNALTLGTYSFYGTRNCNIFLDKIESIGSIESVFRYSNMYILSMNKLQSLLSNSINYHQFQYVNDLQKLLLHDLSIDFLALSSKIFNINSNGPIATLTTVDLGYTSRIDNKMTSWTALTTIVLRSPTVVAFSASSIYSSDFLPSAFSNGTGNIYVPAALLSSYQTVAGWSLYADTYIAIEGSEWDY